MKAVVYALASSTANAAVYVLSNCPFFWRTNAAAEIASLVNAPNGRLVLPPSGSGSITAVKGHYPFSTKSHR